MNNSTSKTTAYSVPSQGLQQHEYYKIAAYCVVIVLSLIGNSLVIAVVYKNANQRMRTPNNYFVVNMAVGDGLITIVNMVNQVVLLVYDSSSPLDGLAGSICCKIQNFMWMFLISWSTGSLSAIAVDRFFLVFVPLKRIITLRLARAGIAAIIITGAVTSWPLLFFSTLVDYDGKKFCSVNMSSFNPTYYLFLFVAFIFFPLLTLLVLYTAIAIKLWLRTSPGNPETRERMNRRIVTMLITIVVLFIFCWMPVSSLYFGCFAFPSSESCSQLRHSDTLFVLWFVAYSNSAINPYVYFIFNEHFRHGASLIWSSLRASCTSGLFNRNNRVGAATEMNPTVVVGIHSQASNEQ